jgi:hypothetical protein
MYGIISPVIFAKEIACGQVEFVLEVVTRRPETLIADQDTQCVGRGVGWKFVIFFVTETV